MWNKTDILLLKKIIVPLFGTFFIAEFIFTMQFIWKYIDDLVGKGLESSLIFKLVSMFSITMLPLALPLSLLLASCMVLGNLGENNELLALKSSGISLLRTIRLPLVFVIFICFGSFYINNKVIPVLNLKYYALLYDLRKHKPALDIRENIFYRGISGFTLRIGGKSADNTEIYDIMLYDHSSGRGNDNVLMADKGEMYLSPDDKYLIMNIYNGVQYQDIEQRSNYNSALQEQTILHFDKLHKVFDLTEFKLSRTDKTLFKGHQQMMNMSQLKQQIDSTQKTFVNEINDTKNFNSGFILQDKIDTSNVLNVLPIIDLNKIIYKRVVSNDIKVNAAEALKSMRANLNSNIEQRKNKENEILRYKNELYKKFNLSFSCFILFIIGCSMGSIVRKGGFGMPILISVIYYMLFHVLNMGGEKLAVNNELPSIFGMWLSNIVLAPIALFIFYKANTDTPIFKNEFRLPLPKWLSYT
jgi:lipopolysaccharide export system permease protein